MCLVLRAGVPPYILPAPSAIATAVEGGGLAPPVGLACWSRSRPLCWALCLAVIGGVALAVLFSLSRVIEYSLYPIAVVLQVTPVIAVRLSF